MSRPVWGAWIEIAPYLYRGRAAPGRAPYGARGLKYQTNDESEAETGRAPYGARGLKLVLNLPFIMPIVRRAPYGARGLK